MQSTQSSPFHPTLLVADIWTIPSATTHFNNLRYDIVEYTPFQHHETYEQTYALGPLQAEPINYLGPMEPNLATDDVTQQSTNTTVASFPRPLTTPEQPLLIQDPIP